MRKAPIAVLLAVLFSVPVFAIQPRVAYLGDITSIAWMDGGT